MNKLTILLLIMMVVIVAACASNVMKNRGFESGLNLRDRRYHGMIDRPDEGGKQDADHIL